MFNKVKESWNDYFEEHADSRSMSIPIIDCINKTLKELDRKQILDAGCGAGKYSSYINKLSHNVIGIDYSKEAIEIANTKYGNNEMKFKCINMTSDLPFDNNYFDVITCINTIHCLEETDREKVLNEFRRILKPDGILLLTLFSVEDKYMPRSIMKKIDSITYKDKWSNRIYAFYDDENIEKLLKEFKVIEKKKINEERIPDNSERDQVIYTIIATK